ncbi:FliO/MopB family protein [Kordiimonas lacus]|uniref:Flagellar biosynthesis protein, FliO n=1 Tax=Kordiimonas lacus TaxID=637679 RepID=A0A1G7CMF1_9PROT|nr:flagellar biosynthetic protein FliO [Kordiimonas lacus]SDE40518.1 Flagellar biosynthesis protein, FliO [Kordiimonas lacus]
MTSEAISAFSILFVMLGFLALAAWAVKRFGLIPGQPRMTGKKREITILDSQMLDARNRLVVVHWRGRDYFLGTGQHGVTLIDGPTGHKAPSGFEQALAEETQREKP